MSSRPALISILSCGLLLGGCAGKAQVRSETIEAQRASFDDVWQVCLASLKERGLEVDRQDRRFGVIVSKPVVGKQFFEPWRGDTASSEDLLISSLHTVRRIVTIRVATEGTMEFLVDVEARAERASVPGDQLDNVAEAFELLRREGVPATPSRRDYVRPRPEPVWVDIGREPALEQVIMEDIASRLQS